MSDTIGLINSNDNGGHNPPTSPPSLEPSEAPKQPLEPKFKCSICFEPPTDAVVTACGHMYCWRCLHNWLERGSGQCPVCKSGVTVDNVIPIYGGTDDPNHIHPASKEGQEAARKAAAAASNEARSNPSSLPNRPRAHRTEPPLQSRNEMSSGASVQFGFFPFGLGVQFSTSSFPDRAQRSLTPEEQRSQFISSFLIFVGVATMFWAIFIDSLSS